MIIIIKIYDYGHLSFIIRKANVLLFLKPVTNKYDLMRKLLFLFLLLNTPFLVMAQSPAADSAWIVTNYTKKEVYIPMRDGIRLYTAIYAPKAGGHHPFLLNRTPYSIGPYGENSYKAFWNSHYMNYLKENYIIVLQDVRGKYMSEGEFMDGRP